MRRLEKKMGQTDRQTDGRTPDRYITLTAKRGQCNNSCNLTIGLARFLIGGDLSWFVDCQAEDWI